MWAAGSSFPPQSEGDGGSTNRWGPLDASTFSMRGVDYNSTKLKTASAPSLYHLVGMDFVKSPRKIDNFASQVQIPEEWRSISSNHPAVPPIFVVNAQLPSDFSTSFFKEVKDGDGWSLVFYYAITQETANELLDLPNASPAVKLFVNFCTNAIDTSKGNGTIKDQWKGRFKITLRCDNIDEFKLPSFITSYNAKPVLIRNTGCLYRGPHYMEMDVNIHSFASVPKKALEVLFSRFDKMKISAGFCIESRDNAELPETLLGTGLVYQPTHSMAPPFEVGKG